MPKIFRHKNHIDRGVLADGQLPRPAQVIQQLARGADLDVGFAHVLERRHAQRGENAEDRDDDQQFQQREGGRIANRQLPIANSATAHAG